MGLGDFISKYVIELPVKQDAPVTTQTKTVPVNVNVTPSTTVNVEQGTVQGTLDKKFIDHFESVLRAANKPGPDAFEYMNMLNSLEGLGLTEEQTYKVAWNQFINTDGATARTVDSLSSDLVDYIKIINADQDTNFNQQVEEAKKNKLGRLSAQRDQINKDVVQWTTEIQALQQKITAANETLVSVDSQYVAEEAKLDANIKNYVATKQAVLSNLQRISDTVKIHLQ